LFLLKDQKSLTVGCFLCEYSAYNNEGGDPYGNGGGYSQADYNNNGGYQDNGGGGGGGYQDER
jgi:hypothetical protein